MSVSIWQGYPAFCAIVLEDITVPGNVQHLFPNYENTCMNLQIHYFITYILVSNFLKAVQCTYITWMYWVTPKYIKGLYNTMQAQTVNRRYVLLCYVYSKVVACWSHSFIIVPTKYIMPLFMVNTAVFVFM